MISVVIPIYNEVNRLRTHVEVLSGVLRGLAGEDWEVILVDDGSSDGSDALIATLTRDSHVVSCRHEVNRGKGAAVRTGVLASRGDAVLFCDADMSTPPETLIEFMAALEQGADVVIGNRKSREARIERWQPPVRIWLGLGFTWLANTMTGLSVNDYTCGFKLFRGEAARRIFQAVDTPGWSFDVEILARAGREDLTVIEIPVRWSNVDGTRVRLVRDVIRSFVELVGIRRRVGKPRKRA
jgi:dolichyl-phosphate beta-glucosyltransferase